MAQLSLEELATMSEAAMVRRRFDEHNLGWAYIVAWLFVAASFVVIGYSIAVPRDRLMHLIVGCADAAVTLVCLAAMSELRLARTREDRQPHAYARAIGRQLPAAIVTMYVVKVATLVYFASADRGAWVAWALFFPLAALVLRLLLRQRIVLHLAMTAVFAAAAFLAPVRSSKRAARPSEYIPIAANQLIVFGIGALTSRNARRRAIVEGMQQRQDALERLRIRDELRFAREVQLSMLPEAPPELAWADVAGDSIPATEVGGDYYDYFVVDGRLAVVCGDVAGHGLASGITLSALRSGFTLLRASLLDPAHVLERLQEVVQQSSRRRMMVALAVLLLDEATHTATIASAGHPPLLVRRAATGEVETIELFAPPLGARLGNAIPQRLLPFASGDLFVLHSDGIYESANPEGQQYGIDRLAATIASARGTADEIKSAILRDVETFRGTERQDDDITIVVVRIA